MTALPTDTETTPSPRGEALFTSPTDQVRLASALESAGLVQATVEAPEPSSRGRLREVIEAAIESALEERGAAPPGLGASSDLDASLSDQLFRARHVGANGLAIHIGSLVGLTNLAGALDAEDSAVLRWWIAATEERPVVLLLCESNRHLGAYGPPIPLERLLPSKQKSSSDTQRSAKPQETRPAEPSSEAAPPSSSPAAVEHSKESTPSPQPAEDPPTRPPLPDAAEWRAWAAELDAAKGPKPLGAIERLFVSRYVPLSDVLARGGGDAGARRAIENWSSSFARSYGEAFGTLRITGKRPMMVLDVPQLASRIARLHGARSTQLVLVDSMRFDLGLRVQEIMREALGSDAACTERLLLWAALPTTTPTQLDLLAKGPDGLATFEPSEREEHFSRGRGLTTLRRVKVGPRDVLKLDVIEARLREPGAPWPERLDALAEEAAEALVGHARLLQPRTMMFVFGDHGFRIETSERGSSPAQQGQATPEEVLVPGFAWIIGGVH